MASKKEKAWLAEYLKCFNATEAARRAGYKWPGRMGWKKKEKFADEIARALDERVMEAQEALAHLSDQARADISPYIDARGVLDLHALIDAGLGHLVKSVRRVVTKFDDRLEVEIYDRQSALKTILAHHDAGDPDRASQHVVMTLDEWKEEAERRRKEAAETMAMFDDEDAEEEE